MSHCTEFPKGTNIEAGDRLFVNSACVFVDPAKITFGDDVLIGPQCGFYTAIHPLDSKLRREGYEVELIFRKFLGLWETGENDLLVFPFLFAFTFQMGVVQYLRTIVQYFRAMV